MGGVIYALGCIHIFALFLIFCLPNSSSRLQKKTRTYEIAIMPKDTPSATSHDAPSDHGIEPDLLNIAFDAMLLDP
jgi:hypothetical protein